MKATRDRTLADENALHSDIHKVNKCTQSITRKYHDFKRPTFS